MRAKVSLLRGMQRHFEAGDTLEKFNERMPGNPDANLVEWNEIIWAHLSADMTEAMMSEDSKVFQRAYERFVVGMEKEAGTWKGTEIKGADEIPNLRKRWDRLISITRRLETMAHKQLRKMPWSDEESLFLRQYGAQMGGIMGYFGNSWLSPKDDAGRWVEVARDPRGAQNSMLAAAVGRPRFVYVLYPWNGYEVLCQGSVMQYYEYGAKGDALTDGEWMRLLDSGKGPKIPEWLREFAGEPGRVEKGR